jgi:hypothetical protein
MKTSKNEWSKAPGPEPLSTVYLVVVVLVDPLDPQPTGEDSAEEHSKPFKTMPTRTIKTIVDSLLEALHFPHKTITQLPQAMPLNG